MNGEGQTPYGMTGILNIGELVILTDEQRAVIVEVLPGATQLHYIVELPNGIRQQVEAGGLIRARTYANWVAPGSNWDGRERRRGNRAPEGSGWVGPERRQP